MGLHTANCGDTLSLYDMEFGYAALARHWRHLEKPGLCTTGGLKPNKLLSNWLANRCLYQAQSLLLEHIYYLDNRLILRFDGRKEIILSTLQRTLQQQALHTRKDTVITLP